METKAASTLTKMDAALHLEALSELMRGYSPEQGGLGEVSVKALGSDLMTSADAILDVLERSGSAKQDIE